MIDDIESFKKTFYNFIFVYNCEFKTPLMLSIKNTKNIKQEISSIKRLSIII